MVHASVATGQHPPQALLGVGVVHMHLLPHPTRETPYFSVPPLRRLVNSPSECHCCFRARFEIRRRNGVRRIQPHSPAPPPWGPRLAGPHTGWVHHIHSSFTASHAPRDQLSVMCVLGLPKACSPGDHAVVRSRCTTLASADKWTTRAASEEPDDLREAPHHEALDHVYMQCESSAWSHPPEWAHDHAALL